MLELRESGELRRLENKWWYDRGSCGGGPNSKKKVTAHASSARQCRTLDVQTTDILAAVHSCCPGVLYCDWYCVEVVVHFILAYPACCNLLCGRNRVVVLVTDVHIVHFISCTCCGAAKLPDQLVVVTSLCCIVLEFCDR